MTTPLVELNQVTKRFGGASAAAIDAISAEFYGGHVAGLVGPDGAGKTTLMRLMAGLLLPTSGAVSSCGFDTRDQLLQLRQVVSYMPQRFGLYEDLTVSENLRLHADLRNVVGDEREETIHRLLDFTDLKRFTDRLAGKMSGGMKQKLGLACALIKTPRLLLLDEPGVGVDPISRRELWRLVYDLVDEGIAVVWSTAYLDEAERCGMVLTLDRGKVLFAGAPDDLLDRVNGRTFWIRNVVELRALLAHSIRRPDVVDSVIQGRNVRVVLQAGAHASSLNSLLEGSGDVVATRPRFEDAFVDLLGGAGKKPSPLAGAPLQSQCDPDAVVEATGLTKRFGNFVAADKITFRIGRGEIYGLLGPNGAGKSTTFKMLCGLSVPTAGRAAVAGYDLYQTGSEARSRLGYMAQKFSLYGDLSTLQNLQFFAGVYGLTRKQQRERIETLLDAFELKPFVNANSKELPLGFKQRLALACSVLHDPAVLFLDEPTSGVDPLTRREFWSHINAMVERGVTVLVTTHFLDEAEYCDRIALVYRGQIIARGSPDQLKEQAVRPNLTSPTLEDAFIELVQAFDAGVGVS